MTGEPISRGRVPGRAIDRRAAAWLRILLTAAPALACAAHHARGATEATLQTLREPPPEGSRRLAEQIGHDAVDGALGQLASPEGVARISTVVGATVTRSIEAALRSPLVVEGRRGGEQRGRSLVDRVARDSATAFGTAFSDQLQRELGPDGRGPLAESLSATVARASGSAVRGAGAGVGELFPPCPGGDRSACLDAQVRSLGRAAAAGFMEGVAGSSAWSALAWSAMALAFLAGVAFTLLVAESWRLVRRRMGSREVHSRA